jgi:hypothetical protein
MQLFLRVFADCPTPQAAMQVQKQLLESLAPWKPEVHAPPLRYWKMNQYFEFTFNLAPASQQALEAIHARSPAGWTDSGSDGDLSCVWNRAPGLQFLAPAVGWAELALSP